MQGHYKTASFNKAFTAPCAAYQIYLKYGKVRVNHQVKMREKSFKRVQILLRYEMLYVPEEFCTLNAWLLISFGS